MERATSLSRSQQQKAIRVLADNGLIRNYRKGSLNGGQLQNKQNSIAVYRTKIRITTQAWAQSFVKKTK
ncbi:hypothetical protein Back11_08190 [Paenibacillus baekrokdamisoli]|uniref:Uncharacterized protein n=1 Tax=Paenibacillus baekrokdamisoli TaxID=1712516 RepID=A0A3G9J872_9BACL|nr:hypothetical protein [Paenibacillus baekrokdamisoli]BBH19474.1 hypothetical protein Back11_08190 [Paenibacillus baekrokdamisoli]